MPISYKEMLDVRARAQLIQYRHLLPPAAAPAAFAGNTGRAHSDMTEWLRARTHFLLTLVWLHALYAGVADMLEDVVLKLNYFKKQQKLILTFPYLR